MNLHELKNKQIAILGFGKEGKSTLSFLLSIGCENITVLDKNENYVISSEVEKSVKETNNDLNISKVNCKEQIPPFQSEGQVVKFITGENYLDNIDSFDYIFKSPGISPYTNNLLKYKNKILTQTKLFYELYKGKIISVTQTKGKSTTVTLVYELLKNAGYKVKLVGNIGIPVLDEIDLNDNYDFVVYELSSYMLEDLDNHHSFISILGNIYPDHLDWHQDFVNYKNAKLNILNNAENILVGYDLYSILDKKLFSNQKTFGPKGAFYSHLENKFYVNGKNREIIISPKIPGEHNLNNFAAIIGVCDILGINFEIFQKTIDNFRGLPHRLQNIGTYKGITFIDDAISTTPESTIEAIKTYGSQIGTIFLGGTDRGYNFEELVKYLEKFNIKNIVLFPETGKRIKEFLNSSYSTIETVSMNEAVEFAYRYTEKGRICLLSTASPSYFIWKNFEEKGDEFKKYIEINKEL